VAEDAVDETTRAEWSRRQGLDGSLAGASTATVLEKTGWMRSVGGAGPYLGLHARAGLSRAAIDAAVAAGEISELPAVRGCTYVVPKAHFALALRAGQGHGDAAAIATAKKHCGVTDAEIDTLCRAILDALARGPLEPRELKEAAGSAVRHLGDVGKKRGVTTTLSLGLGRLQTQGEIRRIPVDGRLDRQRYAYQAWSPSPLARIAWTDAEVAHQLATLFARWIGLPTADQLAWWAGLTKRAASAAIASVGPVEPSPGAIPSKADVRLVGSLDNLFHLRRAVAPLVAAEDAAIEVTGGGFGPSAGTGSERVSTVLDLPHHAIVDRGRLIGVWDFDAEKGEIAWRAWHRPAGLEAAIAATTHFVRDDLGDARAFSLDSPASRGDRLAALRAR
jgi:hypothetical protein